MTVRMGAFQVAAAVIGTAAFAVLFDVPPKRILFCGLTGGVGWLIYLVARHYLQSAYTATLLAAIGLAVCSRALATLCKAPSIVFLICGIFTLVPGAGIYYTAYYMLLGKNAQSVANGLDTLKITLMIALGIIIAYSLPHSLFGWKKSPRTSGK